MPRSREILLPWDSQPRSGAEISSDFSRPLLWLVPNGKVFQDVVSGADPAGTYSNNTASIGVAGLAVAFSAGGWASNTYSIFGDTRTTYTFVVTFDHSSSGSNRTIMNSGSGTDLQIRLNSTNKLELLDEGTALYGTGVTTISPGRHTIVVTAGTGGSTRVFCDGALEITWAGVINVGPSNLTDFKLMRRGGGGETLAGKVYFAAYYSGVEFPLAQAAKVSGSPGILAAPQTIWVPVSAGGGGTTNLTVADATHAHTLDAVVLTSSTALVVQDIAHGHALGAVTLSTGTALTVADSLHAHALDNVTLSTAGAISLIVADLAHAQAFDAVVLTSQTDLTAADMAHTHALDGVTLTLGGVNLVIADIMHAHALDNVALTLDTYLAVADLLHAHTLDNVLVSIPGGTLDLILKILVNRQELNPATGTFTLYDDDGVTVLYTTSAWADAAGTVPYSGGALRRIDALF